MRTILTFLLLLMSATAQDKTTLRQFIHQPTEARMLTAMAASMAADAITTQHMLSRGHFERDPVARPLVTRGITGQAAASALTFAGAGLAAWQLERRGHRRWARGLMLLATASATACAVNNARLE